MDDLHALPKIRDSLTYIYVEHARIDRHEKSVAVWDANGGYSPVPAATLCVLMLGPGTTVSHAAIQALADNNCLVIWCGEENVRFYAFGTGGTRSAAPLLLQARLASDENTRLEVVKRMYRMRFDEWPSDAENLTIEQLRGMEGARVRAVYAEASRRHGIVWDGRNYDRSAWNASDPVNRALSAANACLYGLCHAALLATGYSPGIGFIHTGKQLSFVYDLADLYKTEVTIPVAFQVIADGEENVERAARLRCRDRFRESKLLQRIVPDLQRLFGGKDLPTQTDVSDSRNGSSPSSNFDNDKALPGSLWAPQSEGGQVAGGTAYGSSIVPRLAEPNTPPVATNRAGVPEEPRTIEDLFRAPVPPEESAHSATITSPQPTSSSTESESPFGPDPGCEIPPWGNGLAPWERLRKLADAERAKSEKKESE